ncbi:class I SAM-dependent methyltransferase [Micromonospora zamorensis]|uniref:daptide-type RiPP biosynthesis methyltransferase n=1 Tax=Micromonospora zamorensis TaxID=709883 RepID=UPI00352B2D83|nr:class I SAM-dependent methyltransferase [Micromonospora zamorensis]
MPTERAAPRGTAAAVAGLIGPSGVSGIYGPGAAALNGVRERHDRVGVPELLRLAERATGPILELGCGTGRLTFPLLQQGHHVVALDLSPDMLDVLRHRLAEPANEGYADRLEIVQADMADLDLGRRFDLIVAPASAVWENDAGQRARLFTAVRHHLTDGGHFVLQIAPALAAPFTDRNRPVFENVEVFVLPDARSPVLLTLFDHGDPGSGVRTTAVLTQRVRGGSIADNRLYTGTVHPVDAEVLSAELVGAGLRTVRRHEIAAAPVDIPSRKPTAQLLLDATT